MHELVEVVVDFIQTFLEAFLQSAVARPRRRLVVFERSLVLAELEGGPRNVVGELRLGRDVDLEAVVVPARRRRDLDSVSSKRTRRSRGAASLPTE